MLTEFEGKVVKFLETIAECLVKSNEMAKESLKKSNQLYEANMAIMKERYDKEELDRDKPIPLTKEQLKSLDEYELLTPDSNTPINECEDEEEEDEDMPF